MFPTYPLFTIVLVLRVTLVLVTMVGETLMRISWGCG
jgi:hypothetical protein